MALNWKWKPSASLNWPLCEPAHTCAQLNQPFIDRFHVKTVCSCCYDTKLFTGSPGRKGLQWPVHIQLWTKLSFKEGAEFYIFEIQ